MSKHIDVFERERTVKFEGGITVLSEISYQALNNEYFHRSNILNESITKNDILKEKIKEKKDDLIFSIFRDKFNIPVAEIRKSELIKFLSKELKPKVRALINYDDTHINFEVYMDCENLNKPPMVLDYMTF